MRILLSIALVAMVSCSGHSPRLPPTAPTKAVKARPSLQPVLIDVGEFTVESLTPVVNQTLQAVIIEQQKEIWFRIDSPGGLVDDGLMFMRYVEDLKRTYGFKVKCVVDFNAYSMGFFFLQSPVCDERMATNRATLMAHLAYASPASKANPNMLRAVNEGLILMGSKRLKISTAEFAMKLYQGDWFMGPLEALHFGAIDRIVDSMDLPVVQRP